MEPFEVWQEIFTRAREDGSKEVVATVLNSAPGYLRHVPKKKGDFVLEKTFKRNKGLYIFIESILCLEEDEINLYNDVLIAAFNTVELLIDYFIEDFDPYVAQTKDICFRCVRTRCSFDVRAAACKILKKIIEVFNYCDVKLQEIETGYLSASEQITKYIIIGAVVKHIVKRPNMALETNVVFGKVLFELQKQCNLDMTERNPKYIKIYLDCLSDILTNLELYSDSTEDQILFLKKLYLFLIVLCEPDNSDEVINKTIKILSTHIKYFSSCMCEDYKTWHTTLNTLWNNKPSCIVLDASKAFYEVISFHLLTEYKEDRFLHFRNYFMLNFANTKLPDIKLSIILYGLGQFAKLYTIYPSTDINEVFRMIAHRVLPLCSKEEKDMPIIPYYLEALSEIIIHMPYVSFHHLDNLTKLSIFSIKKFADLKPRDQTNIIKAFKIIFGNVKKLDRHLQYQYFTSLIYEGILWSCSHAIYPDVELQHEFYDLSNYNISYKNYLPLWNSLLEINGLEEELRQQIFLKLISALIFLSVKLNLNVKTEEKKKDLDEPVSLSVQPENEIEFRYFINLIDLYVEIFDKVDVALLEYQLEKIVTKFIKQCFNCFMLSGFYKIIEVIFKKTRGVFDYEKGFNKHTNELIVQFLSNIIHFSNIFTSELMMSCIYLILNTPIFFVKDLISEVLPIIRLAFKLGLNNISLASFTLETLGNWTNSIENEDLSKFVKESFAYLEPYFSKVNPEKIQEICQYLRNNELAKFNSFLKNESSLENFQKKILLFYGSFDYETSFLFLEKLSLETNSRWSQTNILVENCYFGEVQVEVSLGIIMLEVYHLIETANRKTKFSACELFHTLLSISLSKRRKEQYFRKKYCFMVLRLGCDSDDAIRNLFHPFAIQMTHFLSAPSKRDSKLTSKFINSMFDGMCEEQNATLREYCGICLREFVHYRIKQDTDKYRRKFTNFKGLFDKVIHFALHPANNKCVAAAIAFTYLSPTFHENNSVINSFWFEFLYVFIKSLATSNDMRITNVINHLVNVIKISSNVLNAKSSDRRTPLEFENGSLEGAVLWLLEECANSNITIRKKCMEVFEKLVGLLPNCKTIQNFIEIYNINRFNNLALRNLEDNFETLNLDRANYFFRCLDIYSWIFNNKFLIPDSLLINSETKELNPIFSKCFKNILSILVHKDLKEMVARETSSRAEAGELFIVLNKIVQNILNFLSTLVLTQNNTTYILEAIWNEDLSSLIYNYTLYPRRIGLTSRTIELYANQLESWYVIMKEKLPASFLTKLRDIFLSKSSEDYKKCLDINGVINRTVDVFAFKRFMHGIIILKKYVILDTNEAEHNLVYVKDKLTAVFEALKAFAIKQDDGAEKLEVPIQDHIEDLMCVLLFKFEMKLVEPFVNLLLKGFSFLASNASKNASKNFYDLFKNFKEAIYRNMMKNPKLSLKVIKETLQETPDEFFLILEDLFIYVERHRSIKNTEDLGETIIQQFNFHKVLLDNDEQRIRKFTNIIRIAVSLKNNPIAFMMHENTRDFYKWILEEFKNADRLEKKSILIENFLVCMTDETGTPNSDLTQIFKQLRNKDSAVWSQTLQGNESERSQSVQCLYVLLRMLLITRSWPVFEGIVRYASGACSILMKDGIKDYIRKYLSSISIDRMLNAIELTFEIFRGITLTPTERLDVIDYFIIPLVENSESVIIEVFYERNMRRFSRFLLMELSEIDLTLRKHTLVTKIGVYKLFELMCGKVQSSKVTNYFLESTETLTQFLHRETVALRRQHHSLEDEKELMRKLQCAAYNCYIATTCLKTTLDPYVLIFRETPDNDEYIWRKIVDCQRTYNYARKTVSFTKKTVNISKTMDEAVETMEAPISIYFQRREPTEIDCPKNVARPDRRRIINLEDDELNQHECMPTLVGAIMHLYNNKILTLPRSGQEIDDSNAPAWVMYFREGFFADRDNVTMFLLKVISNMQQAFSGFMLYLFEAIAHGITVFLGRNPINYIVRDILSLIIDAEIQPKETEDIHAARKLVEVLMEKAPDSHVSIYDYNFTLIDKLVELWSATIQAPVNIVEKIQVDEVLGIRMLNVFLKHGVETTNLLSHREIHNFFRRMMQNWQNSHQARITYETVGLVLKYIEDQQRENLIRHDFSNILNDMQGQDPDFCIEVICMILNGCRKLSMYENLWDYINPANVNCVELKAKCYEITLDYIYALDPESMEVIVKSTDLEQVMINRVHSCIKLGFRIIDCMSCIWSPEDALPYLKAIETYTKKDSSFEFKKSAYGIFMEVYDKFGEHTENYSDRCKEVATFLRNILINGITDSSDEIHDDLLYYWRMNSGIPKDPVSRLKHLFNMYTLEVASNFAQFVSLMMLNLANIGPNDRTILLQPLKHCDYEMYLIDTPHPWRRQVKKVPMCAPSLSGLLDKVVQDQDRHMGRDAKSNRVQELPASGMNLKISTWIAKARIGAAKSRIVPLISDPEKNQLTTRFLPTSPVISESEFEKLPLCKAAVSVDEYYTNLKKYLKQENNNVKVNRRYKIGTTPDTRITQECLVTTLKDTIQRDQNLANIFLVSLISSLMTQRELEGMDTLMNSIQQLFQEVLKQPNDFAPTAIEILIRTSQIPYNPNDVTEVAKKMDEEALGISLLEKQSMNKPTLQWRLSAFDASQLQHNVQLAMLYQSAGDYDTTHSIFKNWLSLDLDNFRQNYLTEIERNWRAENAAYKLEFGNADSHVKDYIMEDMLRSLSELSSWSNMNEIINDLLNDNYNSIWDNPRQTEIIMPWLLTAQLQKMMQDFSTGRVPETDFLTIINDWVDEQGPAFTKFFGDQIAIFYLCSENASNEGASMQCLRNCVDYATERWINLKYFTKETRLRLLKKMMSVREVDEYLKTIKSKDLLGSTRKLINYWEKNSPNPKDDFLNWKIIIGYRLGFSCFLKEKLKDISMDDGILNDLATSNISQQLKIINLAHENGNQRLSRQCIKKVEKAFSQINNSSITLKELQYELDLANSQLQLLAGQNENDVQNKFIYYIQSWKLAENLIKNENLDISTTIKVKHHVFDVTTALYNSAKLHFNVKPLAMENEFVTEILDIKSSEQFEKNLINYALNMLKNTCSLGNNKEMAESYIKLAKYCYELIQSGRFSRDLSLQEQYLSTVLAAMTLGSQQATRYFSYFLNSSVLTNNEQIQQNFINGCQNVPSWMFLSWQEQIVLHLTTPLSSLILPIVERLAKDYPNAIIYSFRMTYEAHSELSENPAIRIIHESLFSNAKVNEYFDALKCLYHPKYFLKNRILELIQSGNNCELFETGINLLYKKMFSENEVHQQGSFHKKYFDKYRQNLQKLQSADYFPNAMENLRTMYQTINKSLPTSEKNSENFFSLKEFTTFLHNFTKNNVKIEVPGLYSGKKKPLLRHHVDIWCFEKVVEVVNDSCSCLRISIIGKNALKYSFLVKSEKDVRLDQRMQKIFDFFNEILLQESNCYKRYLFVNTFSVVPISKTLGLIQCLDKVKTLKEYTDLMLQNKQFIEAAMEKYQEWIGKASSGIPSQKSDVYNQALEKYSPADVSAMMEELINFLDWDLLVKAFLSTSLTVDCFIQLRQNFIISYATMCTAHWILGVGNRCLEKILVEVKSGVCCGIDFASVFGTAIDQPVPEIVPFRLTNQILGLLRPLNERDLFGTIMSHVLTAFKKESSSILMYLNVLLHEPLNWNEKLIKTLKADEQSKDVKWSPKKKYIIVQKKLSGAKPSNIMLEELSYAYDDEDDENKYFTLYKHIVSGNHGQHVTFRSSIKHVYNLTPEEQVQCLLDQATDLNVLGRLRAAWCPFF